jgi:hypothetical protein
MARGLSTGRLQKLAGQSRIQAATLERSATQSTARGGSVCQPRTVGERFVTTNGSRGKVCATQGQQGDGLCPPNPKLSGFYDWHSQFS